MVRVGGLDYVCSPNNAAGQRIAEMRLDDGRLVEADKTYKVTGWATVGTQSPGRPVWDLVADYLRGQKTLALKKVNATKLVGVEGNPGLA
jgi:sulfur-oxidizing protein SoxB